MFSGWKRAAMGTLAVVAGLSAPGLAGAQDDADVRFDAEVRWRVETDRALVATGGIVPPQNFLRTRLGAAFDPGENTRIRFTAQDSRVLGTTAQTAADANLGVLEAWFQIDELWNPNLSLQAGRFVPNYGNERIIGRSDWGNAGRSFEGMRWRWAHESGELDLIRAKIAENFAVGGDLTADYDLWALYFHCSRAGDFFLLYDVNAVPAGSDRTLERFTLGTYQARDFGDALDYEFTGAWQGGSAGSADIAAYLLALEVGFSGGGEEAWRLAGGFDWASGDDAGGDGDIKSWNELYYTSHKFRGHMDQFTALAGEHLGLADLYASFNCKANESWSAGAAAHMFRSVEDLPGGGSNLGMELDVWLGTDTFGDSDFKVGGAMFKPNEDFVGAGSDDSEFWGYVQWGVSLP